MSLTGMNKTSGYQLTPSARRRSVNGLFAANMVKRAKSGKMVDRKTSARRASAGPESLMRFFRPIGDQS